MSDLALPGGSRRQRAAASAVGVLLFAVAIVPLALAGGGEPLLHNHQAFGAAWWIFAELGTAGLLLATFYASGILAYALIGAAYAAAGLLEIPYLVALPGFVFEGHMALPEQQISPALWATRTIVFGVLVTAAIFFDPRARLRVNSRVRAARTIALVLVAAACFAAAITATIVGLDRALPELVRDGRLTAFYSRELAPATSISLALAVVVLAAGLRRASALQMWLIVVLGSDALAAALIATQPGEFSAAWYSSWLETLAGASILLVVMLVDLAAALRRLAESARFDALTGLNNRRAFEEYLTWAIGDCEQRGTAIALLIIDIDLFKNYNDHYGHAAGDDAMRDIAKVLHSELHGPADMISRIGGEEFAALLLDTNAQGAFAVGERLRRAVQRLDVPHDRAPARRVTISVGAAAELARNLDRVGLFKAADEALYAAKSSGRNCTVLAKNVPSRRIAFLSERRRDSRSGEGA